MRAPLRDSTMWLTLALLTIAGCVAPSAPEPLSEETDAVGAYVAPAAPGDGDPMAGEMLEHGC
jgi:hypothetical protein